MYDNVVRIKGEKPGNTSVILAGVHGNERCGVEAFASLLTGLKIEAGEVIFLYGNPRSIIENKRYTEANLNRMFKPDDMLTESEIASYEYKRAQSLKIYLDDSSALLDIHASTSVTSNPFVICEENSREVVKYLPIDTVVTGFDKVEPGGTDYYMNKNGKMGICVECGYLGDPSATKVAIDTIERFLIAREHIMGEDLIKEQTWYKMYYLHIVSSSDYHLTSSLSDFTLLPEGTMIGIDSGIEIVIPRDSIILFAQQKASMGEEAFLLGEKI